jgi:Bacterial dnaA protein helix-turn-helix
MATPILEEFHQQHKARQKRIKQAAICEAPPMIDNSIPTPEPEINPRLSVMTTFDIIIDEICKYYSVRKLDILSARRVKAISNQRHMLAYMMYRMTSFTNPQIAPRMNLDPTSVYYGIKKIMANYETHKDAIEELERRINKLFSQKKALIAPEGRI